VDVGEAAVASVLLEQSHVATLFAARHWLYVLEPGQTLSDISPETVAARSSMEVEDCRDLWPRIHAFDSACEILLLDTRPLPAWEIEGECPALVRAHVQLPGRFYASFLRNTETLAAEQFTRVARALVSDCLRNATAAGLDPAECVRRGLAEVGLALEEIELLTPAGSSSPSAGGSMVQRETPSLASSLPRR
jgi:hypothetical protein